MKGQFCPEVKNIWPKQTLILNKNTKNNAAQGMNIELGPIGERDIFGKKSGWSWVGGCNNPPYGRHSPLTCCFLLERHYLWGTFYSQIIYYISVNNFFQQLTLNILIIQICNREYSRS